MRLIFWIALVAGICAESAQFSIEDVKRRTFNYFWELADPKTGLIPDRAPTPSFSSIAAQGFGYVSYLIGVENGYVTREQAADRVLKSLKFFWELPQNDNPINTAGYKGFFYHFLDMKTGMRFQKVELSSIDTTLLMGGVMACLSYFDRDNPTEASIRDYAEKLYLRIDWDWFLYKESKLLSMGWTPEKGFLKALWSGYNEGMLIYILALGSPKSKKVTQESWIEWTKTYKWTTFKQFAHVNFGPLFGHQYSHMFVDFRGIKDSYMRSKGIDYFENSRRATLANRQYCMDNPQNFKGYSGSVWGLTACDGPGYKKVVINGKEVEFFSYRARGAANQYLVDDGTIAPTAAGGSVPFAPKECLEALKGMHDQYGEGLYGQYGFKDAFNPTFVFPPKADEKGWYDVDYLGIDEGPILVMIQNYQNEFVWKLLRKNPYIWRGLKAAGFTGGWLSEENLS